MHVYAQIYIHILTFRITDVAGYNEDPLERETDADFDHTTPVSGSDNDEPNPSHEMARK